MKPKLKLCSILVTAALLAGSVIQLVSAQAPADWGSEQGNQIYLPLVTNDHATLDAPQTEGEVAPNTTYQSNTVDAPTVEAAATTPRTTGIWYSTWYANKGKYIWAAGHGQGSTRQMLGDVNGDGKADAVVYFADGSWYVALSNGAGFNAYSRWVAGHGFGSAFQFLSDVNGDGKADAVVYFTDGSWYVALSNGAGFNGYTRWVAGHGFGSAAQMLGDVNGDGKADAVVYFSTNGSWYVALSNGNGFNGYTRWVTGHGVGSTKQLLGDVTGDGKADAVVYFGNDGSWYVAVSNGAGFNNYSRWITGHSVGSTAQMLDDITGDGKADAVVYFSQNGNWSAATSNGTGFGGSSLWKAAHGKVYSDPNSSTWQGLGRVYGGTKAAPVAFYNNGGLWKILPADNYPQPNMLNTWEAWNIKYRPLTLGQYRIYDTTEPAVIDEHLKLIAEAQIDFMIFDETNGIDTDGGYIKAGAQAVCKRIQVWNSVATHRPIKYAIAIGGMQSSHTPETMENEAAIAWRDFVTFCGASNYFSLSGKPLLISYAEYTDRRAWERWPGNKTNTNRFTIRWIQGKVPNNATPPAADYNLYFGWGYPQGALPNNDVMVVMPGWNNALGECVSRAYNNVEGDFYRLLGWQRVIARKPQIVVINSFNEYAEQTAVAPADTSLLTPYGTGCKRDEKWQSPTFYWEMTKTYNQQYKSAP